MAEGSQPNFDSANRYLEGTLGVMRLYGNQSGKAIQKEIKCQTSKIRLSQLFLNVWLKFICWIEFLILPAVASRNTTKMQVGVICKGHKQFDRYSVCTFVQWISICCPICFQRIIELSSLSTLSLSRSLFFVPFSNWCWIQHSGGMSSASENLSQSKWTQNKTRPQVAVIVWK